MNPGVDTTLLDGLIVGRVDPHIYAFTTETVPNYLKVGDTYRAVRTRLEEWKKYYPNLRQVYEHSAKLDDGIIFRDYAVQDFLLNIKHRERLHPDIIKGIYYSREFFKNATTADLQEAIVDIYKSYEEKDGRYNFYTSDYLPTEFSFTRDSEPLKLRPNQEATVENFKSATDAGRTNLLMYAVMRFGKSFTAMSCALEMKAQLVVIVSAKADVMIEWKKTVEKTKQFEEYIFLNKDSLDRQSDAIKEAYSLGKKVVVFLTLQDLQGEEIKERHKELLASTIDLLIVDETHYGARASEYGKVLREAGLTTSQARNETPDYDEEEFQGTVKALNAKIRLHLSGTPYRILMGDEFEKEDIVAFYQFSDIVQAQQDWDKEHLFNDDSDVNEWDNPYYGFPQMIRFALNPSASAQQKLKELKESDVTYAFSELFKPESLTRDRLNRYKVFKHRDEVLDIFLAIDGQKEDANILSFLNYDKIKEGKMCRHIVCVLPFKASCDALENLLESNRSAFKNLADYTIVNIAGLTSDTKYPSIQSVKSKIADCEKQGKKTITLTVNRMLTGTTVEEWDTMLYFKDTSSPQEYDQAVFRLQNQYIKSYRDGDKVIKFNMKPQTLLVDFDPSRMFRMQELKSLFYITNLDERGNDRLEERIKKELAISPIFVLNQNKMIEVTPTNVIEEVINYSKDKSILDEALDIPVDSVLLEISAIRALIESIKPINAKKGLEINANDDGDGTDIDIPTPNPPTTDGGNQPTPSPKEDSTSNLDEDKEKEFWKKLVAYYTRILFYAFLTKTKVISLSQVIDSISANEDNRRIAQHTSIKLDDLRLIFENASHFKLSHLDGKIQNINSLGRDESLSPLERATTAMRKFARISDSEVVTPPNVATDLVSFIPSTEIGNDSVFLDLSSKQGEIACALYQRYYKTYPNIAKNIYSVATSGLTYELTRKVYESLGMPIENVLNFTSFALLGEKADTLISRLTALRPIAIISAPPYQQTDGGGRGDSGSAIYHRFFEIAQKIDPRYISMYLKANWYSGGRGQGLSDFRETILDSKKIREFHDYPDATTYVNSPVTIRGGVCTFMWDNEYNGQAEFYNHINSKIYKRKRFTRVNNLNILVRYNEGIDILSKVLKKSSKFIDEIAFSRNLFRISSNSSAVRKNKRSGDIKVYLPYGEIGYINPNDIPTYDQLKDYINSWKVIVAKASPGTDKLPHSVVSMPILSEPGSVCTDSHLVVSMVDGEKSGRSLIEYMKTPFFRFMMLLAKNNQNMNKDVFRFVPNIKYIKGMDLLKIYDIKSHKNFIESVIKPINEQ